MEVNFLRKKYPRFIYEQYSYKISGTKPRSGRATFSGNNLEIFFDFKIEPDPAPEQARYGASIFFQPKVVIENINKSRLAKIGNRALNNLIFNLGLMEIPSYWKATCSPEIIIKAGPLNKEQIQWWKDLIMDGMGQFFYENKIDFRKPSFLKFRVLSDNAAGSRGNYAAGSRNDILVPMGGGKDSVVTLEILKRARKNIQCFSLNPTEAAQEIMKIAGFKRPIIVRRKIDEKLLELNRQGFLNGHTPFSAYLAFLSVLVATIFGQKYIALSNERSSNEGNVKYLGKIINHQWSKSFDFEQKFRKYSKKYLTSGVEYFSFLRPLYEIQIAKLFSKYPKYFPAFLSCNVAYQTASGTKKPTKKWCGKCSKCLFVFTILYPFVEEKKLIKIFDKNLFENPEGKPPHTIASSELRGRSASYGAGKNLLPIMQQLIGERGFKPFECVGTKKESLIAFYLSWKKSGEPFSAKLPFLLEYFEKKILPKYPNLAPYRTCSGAGLEKESKKILNSWDKQNNLPNEFLKILKKASKSKRTLSSFPPSLS